ncbi:hypothetical protein M201_gp02 [Haloarcula californiae tailed virus 2]|uniref:Uncharacterized protein n=1 Tax=Haloarcula californiae tailed virus 2 TaxID=1273747 RepID=R4T7N2_9CAUD|nr:hypothetical protein M201_gp02 [Haloarcula californiae tailed virus 2]AGM11779.1 hypothetical protein HCTV2_2 [Haloarcula californiae tailed virus 2]
MTIDRDTRHGEGEDDEDGEQRTGGIVYLDWLPQEGEGTDRSQRVADVLEVEVREGAPDNYDEGELVLHQAEGVAVFDRNHLRGFRAQEGVRVPEYQRGTDGDDSSDTGAE